MDKAGQDEMDCKHGKRWPDIFASFSSVCIQMSCTQLENHSCLFCGCDFGNEGVFLC